METTKNISFERSETALFGRWPTPADPDPAAADLNIKIPEFYGADDIQRILGDDFIYFSRTAAGYLIHSLLKAGKEEAVKGALLGFMESVHDITPREAYRVYYEYMAQYDHDTE